MARIIDRLICFFPFEKTCFEGTGLHVAAVGHPLVDDIAAFRARPAPPLPWGGDCRVGLLPGSRDQEIRRLLPAMWQAARRIEARHPQAAFLIPTTDEAAAARIRARLARLGSGPRRWACVPGAARQVMAEAHAALIASGTATLEAALLDCPTVLTYRVSPLTYLIARMLVRVDYLGLVNLLAGCEVCPECLQYRATPSNLAATVEPLLSDPAARERMRLGMARVRDLLGGPGAAGRAADAVLAAMAPTPAAP